MHKPSTFQRLAALAVATLLAVTAVGALASPAHAVQTDCPTSAGNARLVRWVYLYALDKCPDAAGLAYWTQKLDQGAKPSAVGNAILHAKGHLTLVATYTYQSVGVPPDPSGVAYWAKRLGQVGNPDAQLIALTNTSTFAQVPIATADIVNGIYNLELGRAADSGALTYWTTYINQHGHKAGHLVATLVGTNEHLRAMAFRLLGNALLKTPTEGSVDKWSKNYGIDRNQLRVTAALMDLPEFNTVAQKQESLV